MSTPPAPFSSAEVWSGTPWLFAISGWVTFLIALAMCVQAWRSRKTVVPTVLVAGGVLAGFAAEPVVGLLDHLKWGTGFPGGTFTAFGNEIPMFIPPLYGFYLGTLGYLVWLLIERVTSERGIWLAWLGLFVVDLSLQFPAVLLRAFSYYGDDQPFAVLGYPVQSSVKNATTYLLIGFLAWVLFPRLRGWTRLLLFFLPMTAYVGGAIGMAWPWYTVLATDLPALRAGRRLHRPDRRVARAGEGERSGTGAACPAGNCRSDGLIRVRPQPAPKGRVK